MALIQLSSNIEGINGSIGHLSYSKNRSGYVSKMKAHPGSVHSFTPSGWQISRRDLFKQPALLWQTISESQRRAWNAFAFNISKSNVFGQAYHSSGFNLFCQLNYNLLLIGYGMNADPPSIIPFTVLTSLSISIDPDDDYAVTCAFPGQTIDDNVFYQIYLTTGVKAGTFYVKNKYRLVDNANPGWSDGFYVPNIYPQKLPVPSPGTKIFCRLTPIDFHSGIAGLSVFASCIVPASSHSIGSAAIGAGFQIS